MLDLLANTKEVKDRAAVLVELEIYLGRTDELRQHHLRTTQIHNCAKLCGTDGKRNKSSMKVED